MKLKLLALAGIMTATMGLTACDSNKENAAEDLSDAQEEVQDASEELNEADAGVPTGNAEAAVGEAETAIADAQGTLPTDEAEVNSMPMDDTNAVVDTDAANAADEVVVVEEPVAQ